MFLKKPANCFVELLLLKHYMHKKHGGGERGGLGKMHILVWVGTVRPESAFLGG